MSQQRKNTHKIYRSYSTLLVSITFCLVTLVVVLTNYLRYQDFLTYHRDIASSATGELSHVIERIVIERQRLVQLFADDHVALLKSIAEQPDDQSRQQQLGQEIYRLFPDYFAFTLTDQRGVPLIADFDGYVGELCLTDVQSFAQTGANRIRVHPNAYVYHYDVMAKWGDAGHILLISFPADDIGSLLRATEVPGHELIVFQPDAENLIEITALGTRDKTPRDDFRMPDEMLERLSLVRPIPHTRWTIGDLMVDSFLTDFRYGLLIQTSLLLLMFGGFSLLIGWIMRRNDLLRYGAERTKDEFVSIISHELRTPLTSIQGSLGLLQGGVCGEIGESGREMLAIAISNTERLRLLVDDLLDIRKIESGNLEINLEMVDIMSLVRKSVEQNQGYAARCGVSFVISEQVQNVMVEVDPLRITQVMSNLLSNAAKFSPAGAQVAISIRITDAQTVEVAVHDNGPGIDPQFHSKLFEKFTQVDSSDSRHMNGTGLGLAIVKALVEEHQGSVDVHSQLGQGSTFSFKLPIVSGKKDT